MDGAGGMGNGGLLRPRGHLASSKHGVNQPDVPGLKYRPDLLRTQRCNCRPGGPCHLTLPNAPPRRAAGEARPGREPAGRPE